MGKTKGFAKTLAAGMLALLMTLSMSTSVLAEAVEPESQALEGEVQASGNSEAGLLDDESSEAGDASSEVDGSSPQDADASSDENAASSGASDSSDASDASGDSDDSQDSSVPSDTSEASEESGPAVGTQEMAIPVIEASPRKVNLGDTITFRVVSAEEGATYQWEAANFESDGFVKVPGATQDSFTAGPIVAEIVGTQMRVVTTIGSEVKYSEPITIALWDATEIKTQPVGVEVMAGADAEFEVTATGEELTYQWQMGATKEGPYTNVEGATDKTLKLEKVTEAMSGRYYRVEVTGKGGTVTSDAARLIVASIKVSSITVTPGKLTVKTGESSKLTAAVLPADASNKNVVWSSSDTSIATVNKEGVITGQKRGTVTITATAADGGNAKGSCTLTVDQMVTEIKLKYSSLTILPGGSYKLGATAYPTNANNRQLVWTSSAPSIAKVSADGTITALAEGITNIRASAKDGSGVRATCRVTVGQPVTSVKMSETSKTLYTGDKLHLRTTVAPSNAANRKVVWSSSNTRRATVTQNGVVTALTAGRATITAKAADGSGRTARCDIFIKNNVTRLTLSTSSPVYMSIGAEMQVKAAVTTVNGKPVAPTFTSGTPRVATVDETGLVTAHAAGKSRFTVKAGSRVAYFTVRVVEKATPVASITIRNAPRYIAVGRSRAIKIRTTPANATNPSVVWASNNPSVLTVNEAGVITAHKKGTATISVMVNGRVKRARIRVN